MRLSELVEKLQKLEEIHGDLEVVLLDKEYELEGDDYSAKYFVDPKPQVKASDGVEFGIKFDNTKVVLW
jgi:hypothetical protein